MKYDSEARTLRFGSQAELESFHAELTTLLREVTIAAAKEAREGTEGAARAREVLKQFHTVTRVLNVLRTKLSPTAG